jgi:SAM-dependent methyltransferase
MRDTASFDNKFLSPPFSLDNLDRYVIRKQILEAITSQSNFFHGTFLDVGCGKMPYKKWILENSQVTSYVGLDIESALKYDDHIRPDFTWDGNKMPFENNAYESAMATEVLEHCPDPELVLKEIHRVLKPRGYFFFTVPFIWNLHEVPHDQYRYTPFALERHLKNSGFSSIEVHASGGWHAAMALMLGLWVKRSPLSPRKKKILSRIIKPIMHWLLRADKKHKVQFKEGQMISGLYGWARKQ